MTFFSGLWFSNPNLTDYHLKNVAQALKTFRRVYGQYPTTQQGLQALVLVPKKGACLSNDPDSFIDSIDKDSKKRNFVYQSDGKSYTLSAASDNLRVKGDENGKWISLGQDP
jgi:hypothetical protein